MTHSRLRAITPMAVLLVLLSVSSAFAGGRARSREPFARVYLALRGCTSCSHCRTTIRQMARSGSGGAEARVSTDAVEVRYSKPGQVRLREVIKRLAENRLHDLRLVDVLFEARGTVATTSLGSATFTLQGTDQAFPLALGPSLAVPERGGTVRLTALVEGWREKGPIRLVAREIRRNG